MAYSNLFKSGLMSESSSPLHYAEPWGKDFHGPRRGSMPSAVDSAPSLPSSATLPETNESIANDSIASGDSFYFTFKKRRNASELRSFLSLDLAESQSLRSASLKAKESHEGLGFQARRVATAHFSPFSPTYSSVYSPPPLSTPPRSPISLRGVIGSGRSPNPFGMSFSPPSPRVLPQHTMLQLPQPRMKRSLSPMRFASPPPSPPPPVPPRIDNNVPAALVSPTSSVGPLSRTSTVSSGFRRAQYVDALMHLEGRRANGPRRIIPRVSQNFMSMSDDDDEDEAEVDASIDILVEEHADAMEQDAPMDRRDTIPDSPGLSEAYGLTVSVDTAPWFSTTPRASAWPLLFGDESTDESYSDSQKKLSPFDVQSRESHSSASRQSKRSRRSDEAPRSSFHVYAQPHAKSQSHLDAHRNVLPPALRSKSAPSPRAQTDVRLPQTRPSLEIDLSWLQSPNPSEAANFIDLRDEADSRSDSWRSIFEVSCTA